MSIKALNANYNKSWLTIKSNTINATDIEVDSNLDIKAGGILRLQASDGTSGQIVKKDGSNNISWQPNTDILGSTVLTYDIIPTPVSTASAVYVSIAGSAQAVPITPGLYALHYCAEIRNITSPGTAVLKIELDTPSTVLNAWESATSGSSEYLTVYGFAVLNLLGSETIEWFHKQGGGAGTTETQKIRIFFYRLQ